MMGGITWLKFVEWIAYAELEPFDEVRSDIRAAQVEARIANIFRDSDQQIPISEFVLKFGQEKKEKRRQTIGEQKQIAYMLAYAAAAK